LRPERSTARSLAAELAPQFGVNTVAPSLTDTPLAASLLNRPANEMLPSNDTR
jgi:NAD(P)-dependent dehydrogenase (short-subunit alcohol dehydrogenase family)